MSKQVDERVVSMEFDNSNFEKNVKGSMSTLERLKKALNFKGASKGLEAIDTASKKVNFSSMSNAVDQIGVKFSSMQVIATTALANITNAAVNAGRQMIDAVAIAPIRSGFQEYETQIGSIQTILSNTRWAGTNLDQVTSALDELNTYADKTIYNFTEMTRNIGTFTAAGVGLEESVSAIKGIANLAAASGSTSTQASTAMYQLSQALAAGRVSLMDWNSVVNAGMGGKLFQDALIRTSEVMGTGAKAAIETYGSFRESLTQGQWLTSEVLTETLSQIAGAYSESELLAQGYTQEQTKEILNLAKDAEGAATNVRTFTQLIDTTMEALGSGWTNTWEILVGDFDEAQALFTEISNVLNDSVNQSATARNELLTGWKEAGGRDTLIEGLRAGFEALLSLITPIQEAFSNIFPPMTVDTLVDITNKFKDFMSSLKLTDEAADKVRSVFEGVFSAVKMVGNAIGTVINFIGNFAGNASGAFDAILDFGAGVGEFVKTLSESTDPAGEFGKQISELGSSFGEAASGVGEFLSSGIGKLTDVINSITPDQINTFLQAIATGGLLKFFQNISDTFSEVKSETKGVTSIISDFLKEFTGGFSDQVTGLLDSVRGALEAYQNNLKANTLLKIAVAVGLLAIAVGKLASLDPQALRDSLGAVTVLFGELIAAMTVFEKISTGFNFGLSGSGALLAMSASIAILASSLKSLSDLDQDQITQGVEAIAYLATVMVLATKALGAGSGIALKGAGQLVVLGIAMKVLASVISQLSDLNSDQITKGLVAIGAILGEIAAFSAWNNSSGMMATATSMVFMGVALKVFASVVNQLGTLDTDSAVQGVTAIGVILAELAAFSNLVDSKKLLAAFLPLGGIAGALYTLAHAVDQIGSLGVEKAAAGVTALGAVMAELVIFSHTMPDEKKLNQVSAVMPFMAVSLGIIAASLSMLSGMNIEQIGTALAGFAGSLVILGVAVRAFSGQAKGAGVLLLVATTLTILAAAIDLMALSGIGGVVVGMTALAGTLIILGVAAKAIAPSAPALLSLAGSVAAFGGALASVAVGSTAMAVGLAVSITAIVGALMNLQQSLKDLDPVTVGIALGSVVVAFAALGGVAKLLTPLIPSILSLSGSILMLGLSCAAVAGSIWLIVAAFAALGEFSGDTVSNALSNLELIFTGIIDMLPTLASKLSQAFVGIWSSMFEGASEIIPSMVDSLLSIITEVLNSLLEYGPEIIDFVLSFIIQIIDGVAARVPELVGSIANLVNQLFSSIMEALSSWSETGDAANNAVNFLVGATALAVALNAVKSIIPGAMQGAAMMTAFIVEVGAILTALGALEQLTGASSFIQSGGDLLQSIGTALGQFVGGLVGGVAEGATSTLPQVGTNLSDFATNITPFLEAMSSVDQTAIDGVKNLALAIAALSGANFVDAVASFLTGEGTFDGLGPKLVSFGTAIKQFSDVVTGIDVDAINASANCGQALAALANAMPKEGGLAQAIFGESTDMGEFATQIVAFGMAMKMYAMAVSGVDFGPVQESVVAGQALSELAGSLPKDGGLAQAIFGESTDMGEFGTQILLFGWALKNYAAAVADLDIDSIKASAQAGQALSDLANALPDSGGLVSWLFGDNEIGDFGESMKSFGNSLKSYSDSLVDVDFDRITASTTAVTKLSEVLASGTSLDTSGIANINQIASLGTALNTFYTNISEVELGSVTTAITALRNLVSFINNLAGLDTSGIGSFQAAISQLGETSLDGLVNAFNNADLTSVGSNLAQQFVTGFNNGISNLSSQISSAISSAVSSLSSTEQAFKTSGEAHSAKFAEGIQNGASSVAAEVGSMVRGAIANLSGNYSTFYSAGQNLAYGFAAGIRAGSMSATLAAKAMANAAAAAAKNALAIHSPSRIMRQIGDYAGQGFVLGISDNNENAKNAGQTMADFAAQGASALLGLYNSYDNIEGAITRLTDLRKSLSKEDNTEKETEQTSKLADALNSVITSTEELVSRRRDLNALTDILAKSGVEFGDEFVAELLDAEGEYAGALSEMVNLTDDQLQELSDVYSQSKYAESMEGFVTTISDSMADMASAKRRVESMSRLFSRDDLNLSEGFMAELRDSGGQYADYLDTLVDMTNEQLQQISYFYDQTEAAENMETLFNTIQDSIADASKTKRDLASIDAILNRTGVTFSKNFRNEVMSSGGQYAEVLTTMATLTDEQLTEIADAFDEAQVAESIRDIVDAISANDGLLDALDQSGIDIVDFAENLNELGMSVDDITSKIEDFASSVSDGFSVMASDNQIGLTEFTDNLKDNIDIATQWRDNVDKVFSMIGNDPLGDKFRKDVLEGGFDKYGHIISDLAKKNSLAIHEFLQLYNAAEYWGNTVGTDVVMDIIPKSPDTAETKAIGSDIASGVAKGVSEGTSNVNSAVEMLCTSAETNMRTYFGINSPSKLMEQIGSYIIQGLINGLKSGESALTEAMDAVNNAISRLQQLGEQGIDIQVRVTPVIDASGFNSALMSLQGSSASLTSPAIMNQVNTINSGMTGASLPSSAVKITEAVSKLSDKIDTLDAGSTTFNQYNTSPKALSTADIYRQTRNQISLAKSKLGKAQIVR